MNRAFAAAGFAAALLSPAAAVPAFAAPLPYDPSYRALDRTYVLRCVAEERPNAADKIGEFVITNTTPHVIPRGSKVTITYQTRGGSKGSFVYNLHRDLRPGQAFEFNQQYRDNRCLAAAVTLPPKAKPGMVVTKPNRGAIAR